MDKIRGLFDGNINGVIGDQLLRHFNVSRVISSSVLIPFAGRRQMRQLRLPAVHRKRWCRVW